MQVPDNPPRARNPIAVALAVSAAGMVVGFGTCGVVAASGGSTTGRILIPLGALTFVLSFLAFVATLGVALVKLLQRYIGR